MRAKRCLWVGFVALCLLALTVGYLGRPEDELHGIMKFKPHADVYPWGGSPTEILRLGGGSTRVTPGSKMTIYTFSVPTEAVLAVLPGHKKVPDVAKRDLRIFYIPMHDGRLAALSDFSGASLGDGAICGLSVFESPRPWYERTWLAIKSRLGLR